MQTSKRGTGSLDEQKAWDQYFSYLIKTLKDPDGSVRARTARLLGEHHEPQAVSALTELLLDDPDMGVRQQAATALGHLGAVEPLIQALQMPDLQVRQLATQALGHLGDLRAVEPLIAALRDPHTEVRQQVAFALTKIGAPAVAALLAALQHPDPITRWSVVRVLGTIGDARALPELDRLAREDHTPLTTAAPDDGKTTRPLGTVGVAARQAAEKIRQQRPGGTGALKG